MWEEIGRGRPTEVGRGSGGGLLLGIMSEASS